MKIINMEFAKEARLNKLKMEICSLRGRRECMYEKLNNR